MTIHQRAFARKTTDIVLDCIVLKRREKAIVCDLSPSGCRLEIFDGTARLGAMVLFEIDGAPAFAGEVVWVRDGEAGVRFTRPLQPDVRRQIGLD